MARCQCVVERWRAIKGEIGDLIIADPALQNLLSEWGLVAIRRSLLQVSGFTEFLWDLLSPSLISLLIAPYSVA